MKVDVAQPGACQRVLDIEVPTEEVRAEFEKKVSQYQQNVQIRGFRKGKVPKNMILARYNDAILSEAAEDVINRSYEEACKTNQIVPVSRAKIDGVEYGLDKPLKFKAELEVDCEIELKKYTGFGVKMDKDTVEKEDVDDVIESLQERMATYNKVDRSSKKGDYIKYEYKKMVVDGGERTDYKNPQYPMPIGEAKIKEFNKALVGVKAGDTVDVNFKFPKDWEVEEVRTKPAEFTLAITEILEKELPEVNDEFAKKIGPYENAGQMRERIEEDLKARRKNEVRRKAQEEVFAKIIEKNEIPVPRSRVESYADRMIEEMQKQYQQIKREDVIDRYMEMGEKEIKQYKIAEWVAKREGIKAAQEDVDDRIRKIAEARNENFEDLKERFRRDGTTIQLRSDIKERNTIDWLIEKNT